MSYREPGTRKDLLRFVTAGSVDDGKSTLIGRLLYDSGALFEDQVRAVAKTSELHGAGLDLALFTDGLKAEREQKITIDSAYRYFSTRRRKFILADAPGHDQYTRNMATSASTADLALILIDPTKGVSLQTRRHATICSLLGVRRFLIAVNKMDLVDYSMQRFTEICGQFGSIAAMLQPAWIRYIPISALCGDNIVSKSSRMSWFDGATLLEELETVQVYAENGLSQLRMPIQMVICPEPAFRGYAGQITSGVLEQQGEVLVLPGGMKNRVKDIFLRPLRRARAPMSVVACLEDPVDVERGDMLVDAAQPAGISNRVQAKLIWFSRHCLRLNHPYLLKHTARTVQGSITRVLNRLDLNSLHAEQSSTLEFNDIGEIELETSEPLICDTYEANRATGSFIIIDREDNDTVGAGMISRQHVRSSRPNGLNHLPVRPAQGLTVWFTGLSGSGKSTICRHVEAELRRHSIPVEVLDGDIIRQHISKELGFSRADREDNLRRIAFIANLLARNGVVVLIAAISPYRSIREELRQTGLNFLEVFVNAPLRVCVQRDPKGMYARAISGKLESFTGISDIYEPPLSPDVECHTDEESIDESAGKVLDAISVCSLRLMPKPARSS